MKKKSNGKNSNSVDEIQKESQEINESGGLPPNESVQPVLKKKSPLRRFLTVVLYAILVLLLLTPSLAFLFRDPVVQSLSARLLTNYLSKELGAEISIHTIKIGIKADISLERVSLRDDHDSIMININKLVARPMIGDFVKYGPKFSKLVLDGVTFKLSKYKTGNDFTFLEFVQQFSNESKDLSEKQPGKFKIKIKKLFLTNAKFHLYDEHRAYDSEGKMNYADIVFDDINLTATNFVIVNDSLDFLIDSMSLVEQSGIEVKNMSTEFIISSSGLEAKNLLMDVNQSQLDLDLNFIYSSYKSYGEFLDSVVIKSEIRPSTIDMSNLKFFAERLEQMPNVLGVTGNVEGTVTDFSGEELRLHYGDHTRINLDGRISGLPDIYTTYVDVEIKDLNTNSCEIRKFWLPIEGNHIDLTEYVACEGKDIQANAKFKGYYNDFSAVLDLTSNEGNLSIEADYTDKENDTLHFDIALKGNAVNIGKILRQTEIMGATDLDVRVTGQGHSFDDVVMSGGGTLYNFGFLDYSYSRIRWDASYMEDSINGNVTVGDRHLMMNASLKAVFSEGQFLAVKADVKRADLDDLHLWMDQDFSFKGLVDLQLKGFNIDSMTGYVVLNDSKFSFGEDYYKLNETSIYKNLDEEGIHTLSIASDFLDAELTGKYDISKLPIRIQNLINHYYYSIPEIQQTEFPSGQYAQLVGVLKRSDLLEEQYVSGLSFSPNTGFTVDVDFDLKKIMASSKFEKLLLMGTEFRDNTLSVETKNERVSLDFNTASLILKDSADTDKTVFGLDNFHLSASVKQDSLSYGIYWDNVDSVIRNSGNIEGYLSRNEKESKLKLLQSDVVINDTLWTVNPDNFVIQDSSGTRFKDITIWGGESELSIEGKYPELNGDTLVAMFNDWNLSNFDLLTNLFGFELDGIIGGYLEFGKVNDNPAFTSDIKIDGLALNKEILGTAYLLNKWNYDESSITIDSKVERTGSSGTGEVISIKGLYYPFKDENSILLNIAFSKFKLQSLEPFFDQFISGLEGVASGEFTFKGTPAEPVLTGFVDAHRTMMKVNYLNTKYSFSNKILFEPNKINFDNIVIYDTLGNNARVDGSLKHKNFKDMAFDLAINTDKLLFFNTTSKMNDLYYGSAITSGSIFIKGDPRNISLSMNVSTKDGTSVFLPLDYALEISDKDYIIFVQHEDTLAEYELFDKQVKKEKNEKLGFDIKLGMAITPVAKMSIFLPSDMGKIESFGKGQLRLKTNSLGDFSLIGDYIVEDGLFNFSLANLVSKRFELVRGGRISWTGDPYEANVKLKGLYKVKTSLSSLGIVDSTHTQKVNVECYIVLSNKLLNPDIRFEIVFPNLNPDLQRAIYSELDTTNQAMMNDQMISLLVLGTFSYSNASNVSLSTPYYSVITNQLSNMLSRISDDFDIGVNYRPGDQQTQEEFDVALSTQLFDDRLIIDGNFGMTYDRSGENASNIVGDVDVGYKITPDGRWILKAFNHSNVNSNDNYASYDKVAPYTQGVGVAFRREFTHISEIFKRTRPPKEKKNEKNKEAVKESTDE